MTTSDKVSMAFLVAAGLAAVFIPYLQHLLWMRRERRATLRAFDLILARVERAGELSPPAYAEALNCPVCNDQPPHFRCHHYQKENGQ